MTLPVAPNSISMSQVNTELSRASTDLISLGGSGPRGLASINTGTISMSDLHGKSAFSFSFIGANSTWNTNDGTYTYCWYRYDCGESSQERTLVWVGCQFLGDYDSSVANGYGIDGAEYPPSLFTVRINHRSSAFGSGFYHSIYELKVPGGQRYVDFYTRNTMTTTIVGGDSYNPIYGTSENGSRLYSSGAGLMLGTITHTDSETSGYTSNPTLTAPAGPNGRIVFAVTAANWIDYAPISPYTQRFTPLRLGQAYKLDETSVEAEDFVCSAGNAALSIVSYNIG